MHPRARPRIEERAGSGPIRLIDPRSYLDFLPLQASARLVLTDSDSGGVQEETTVLGVRCVALRENTERPITVSEGTNQLVGRDPDGLIAVAREVLVNGVEPRRPERWDGKVGERIAQVLIDGVARGDQLRPTDACYVPQRSA